MASIKYEEVFSRFYTKVRAYDFLFGGMPEDMIEEFMSSWLHSAIAYPYIRRLFSSVEVSDDYECIEYTLSYPTDDSTDKEFVLEVLTYSMVYSWVEPKVKSITTTTQFFGTSDEKYFSQASHLSELRGLLEDSEVKIRSLIRDRGYFYNTYLDGTTPLRRS